MAKFITFFNHKGGVGKTTLVHNLGFVLADRGYKVLLIDADPQMNLTAAMYGLSTSVEYSTDDESKWSQNVQKYISLTEYLAIDLKGRQCSKEFFRTNSIASKGFVDLISGSINLSEIEADIYGIIKNRNEFTDEIPYKFEQSIRKHKSVYDFVLVDTSPSASSIINALIMMSTDYFITPTSPTFFSLQAVDNLSQIFGNWIKLLGEYETRIGFRGLSFKPKFLGLVVQMAKRFNGGSVHEGMTSFSSSTEKWISDANVSAKKFQRFASLRNLTISQDEFEEIFGNDPTPFIIQKCCDFTNQLRSIAEKAGVPVIYLTQEICNKYKDSKTTVDITKNDGQYARSFNSISQSYNKIADGLVRLLGN
jgi:cellulose biosynthesis protein BcsQ